MTHIIQKQTLELRLDEGPDQKALQDDIAQRFMQEALPAINELFEDWIPAGNTFMIDRLELDLGEVKPENFSRELIRLLKEKLQLDLRPEPAVLLSKNQNLLQQFLYFLRNGHFSWTANGITLAQMERELPDVLEELKPEFKAEVLRELTGPTQLRRLSKQFSLAFQKKVALELITIQRWKEVLTFLSVILPQNTNEALPTAFLSTSARLNRAHTSTDFLHQLLWEIEFQMEFSEEDKVKFRLELLQLARKKVGAKTKLVQKALQIMKQTEPKPSEENNHRSKAEDPANTSESIYIKNAGIVLLWPFLQRFFENLDFMQNGEFNSRKEQEKAICLLQFLANPEGEISENLLPLNKLLCGLDVSVLVPTDDVEINEKTTADAREMLEAVIRNWPKLGNTSVQGFQTAFLQREGLLKKTDNGWKLKVEQRSFDILMDTLPWSITIINLPWMPKAIHVVW